MAIDEGLAILFAAAMATVGILFTGRQQRSLQRRQHTYQAIEKHNDWAAFDRALEAVRIMIDANNLPQRGEVNRQPDIDKIDFLLNYYEFLCASVWWGDIDETLARECERGRVISIRTKLLDYILWNRAAAETNRMWRNFDRLAVRWIRHPDGPPFYDRTIEWFTGHPLPSTAD